MTTIEAPKKKRKPRRGPPGVPCSICNKLAGAEDEGSVDDLSLSVNGESGNVEVSVDSATLMLRTACCGVDFKSYDLSGNNKSVDHECGKLKEQDAAQMEWDNHLTACVEECANDTAVCETGKSIKEALEVLNDEVRATGDQWELDDDQPDVEAYQRYQREARNRKTGKMVPIKRMRYAKSYRGITFSVSGTHALCDSSEDVEFSEGDVELQSSSFDTV